MMYNDSLYGPITIEQPVADLLLDKNGNSVEEMYRLDQLSLASLPCNSTFPRYLKTMDSRLDHSIGTAHLAGVLCDSNPGNFKEYKVPLLISAALHDSGFPAFSHTLAEFQEEVTGMDHELYLSTALKGTHIEEVVKKYGYTLEEITEIVTGEKEIIGHLMNNSIDIDNIDNVVRYWKGAGKQGRNEYDPKNLIKSIRLKGNDVILGGPSFSEIQKWINCRKSIYKDLVYEKNRYALANMVKRAVYFFQEEMHNEPNEINKLFRMGDLEAFNHLVGLGNEDTQNLMNAARNGKPYIQAAQKIARRLPEKAKELCNSWGKSHRFADKIANELGFERKDVCFDLFTRKSEKDLSAQVCIANKKIRKPRDIYDLRVFISPEVVSKLDAKELYSLLLQEIYADREIQAEVPERVRGQQHRSS